MIEGLGSKIEMQIQGERGGAIYKILRKKKRIKPLLSRTPNRTSPCHRC